MIAAPTKCTHFLQTTIRSGSGQQTLAIGAAVTARLSEGKRLVKAIEKALPAGWELTDGDRLVLARIEAAEDRRTALTALFDAETVHPSPSAHKAVALGGEIRQVEAQISKWQDSLMSGTDDPPVKSWRHQQAANARWSR